MKIKITMLFLILGAMTLFFACQKEETTMLSETENQTSGFKILPLHDLPILKPIIENVKKVRPKIDANARGFEDFLNLENIDTDEIVQYTDSTGYSSYTFRIKNDSIASINFEYLHLLETDEGYLAYIINYEPDEA